MISKDPMVLLFESVAGDAKKEDYNTEENYKCYLETYDNTAN